MPYIISVVSQKGGVGKSTIARMIAVEFALMDGCSWKGLLADLDPSQATAFRWSQWREQNASKPDIVARPYASPEQVLADAGNYNIVIVDGAPNASRDTLRVAQAADVVIIPTGTSRDDLIPTIQLANELEKNGISRRIIVFGLNRVGTSELENSEARNYLEQTGYRVASGELRDMVTYRRASDSGRAVTETWLGELNNRARVFFQSLMKELCDANQEQAGEL
ncbi:ParA family protein [Cohaesibacter marisflavi]|uniref:ParA family protein n=1 Tax=Cohaesibacter marisflavi TaxID=655353 RepID=UPI0029C8FFEB|nr:ParA family protein [Cohaesibacter marisflavi]